MCIRDSGASAHQFEGNSGYMDITLLMRIYTFTYISVTYIYFGDNNNFTFLAYVQIGLLYFIRLTFFCAGVCFVLLMSVSLDFFLFDIRRINYKVCLQYTVFVC